MTDMDWAEIIACELGNMDRDNRSEKQFVHDETVKALRKAKADGMYEAKRIAAKAVSGLEDDISDAINEAASKLQPSTD